MTNEERKAVHQALEDAGGDRNIASAELGISPLSLKDKIHASPELKARWVKPRGKVEAPTAESTLSREPLVDRAEVPEVPVLKREAALAKAAFEEDEKLKRGLSALPLKGSEVEIAASLHGFQKKHVTHAADIIHGCATLMAIKLTAKATELMERHSKGDFGTETEDFGVNGALEEEKMVLEAIFAASAEIRKLSEMVGKGTLMKAMLDLKRQENAKAGGRQKPGFAPLLMKADNVHIHEPPKP